MTIKLSTIASVKNIFHKMASRQHSPKKGEELIQSSKNVLICSKITPIPNVRRPQTTTKNYSRFYNSKRNSEQNEENFTQKVLENQHIPLYEQLQINSRF